MKTLNVKASGVFEMNSNDRLLRVVNGDPFVPAWAVDDLQAQLDFVLADGWTEAHTEDTGVVQFTHLNRGGFVETIETPAILVFEDMDKFMDEYEENAKKPLPTNSGLTTEELLLTETLAAEDIVVE